MASTCGRCEPHPGVRSRRVGTKPDEVDDDLSAAWQELEQRHRTVLELRIAGQTLEQVGARLGITRERVRQLQRDAESALVKAALARLPRIKEELLAAVGTEASVPDTTLQRTLRTTSAVALAALLRTWGVKNPRTWAGDLTGWWTMRQHALDGQLRDLVAQAPFSAAEMQARAAAIGLAEGLPLSELLSCRRSPLISDALSGWIRRSKKGTDSAFLWLSAASRPRPSGEIAEAIGWPSKRALSNALRRDSRFIQLRPEGTWALSDWKSPEGSWLYKSAWEAVVDVLREQGPLTLDQLAQETIRRYPVSRSWIHLCLSRHPIGRTDRGMYDLIERGAVQIQETEPRKPHNITESPPGVFTVRLRVDSSMLRGSSVVVSRWLPWRLGLQESLSAGHFVLVDLQGEVVVRRSTTTTALSSLRAPIRSLGLVAGCQLAVRIRSKQRTADIRHACTVNQCPAGLV